MLNGDPNHPNGAQPQQPVPSWMPAPHRAYQPAPPQPAPSQQSVWSTPPQPYRQVQRPAVTGGGTAVEMSGASRFMAQCDAFALSVGTRITISTLMLACLLVIAVGASSLLDSLKAMDADMKVMDTELGHAQAGTYVLIDQMESLPPTAQHMRDIVTAVKGTGKQVKKSKTAVGQLQGKTAKMDTSLAAIGKQTASMGGELATTDDKTTQLAAAIDELNGGITPLVKTNHDMLSQTYVMRNGVCSMNASLAYTIRTLNYMTAPPQGGPFSVRVEMDKKTLPPVPGVVASTEPLVLYKRGAWPIYNETGPRLPC